MRDPEPEFHQYLIELGGWFGTLAEAEVRAVAGGAARVLGDRLMLVERSKLGGLRHLGASRRVLTALGRSDSVVAIPDELAGRLAGTFAVRFRDPRRLLGADDRRRIIGQVWRAHPAPAVDLQAPAHDLYAYVDGSGIRWGVKVADCAPELRGPSRRRPFVRSYEMPSRKARVLVNMSAPGPGKGFLDPFCGTGSLVIEAARVGCLASGSDLDRRAVEGAVLNMEHEGISASLRAANALTSEAWAANYACVATDLPYGRSASRNRTAGTDLYRGFLDAAGGAVVQGGTAVVMSLECDTPTVELSGWEVADTHIEVARTVTRAITTWRRV